MQHEIAKRLREERVRLGLSQDEMAKLGGVTGRSQRNYESGARLPDAAYLAAIGARDVDLQYVLSGIRYEAEMWGREFLLQALCDALSLDLDDLEIAISKAEDAELARLYPGSHGSHMEKMAVMRGIAEDLLRSSNDSKVVGQVSINQELLAEVLESVEQAATAVRITAKKKAQAVVMIYLASQATGKVDAEFVKSAIRLAS